MATVSVLSSTFFFPVQGLQMAIFVFLDKRRLELENVNIFKMEKYISKTKIRPFK